MEETATLRGQAVTARREKHNKKDGQSRRGKPCDEAATLEGDREKSRQGSPAADPLLLLLLLIDFSESFSVHPSFP